MIQKISEKNIILIKLIEINIQKKKFKINKIQIVKYK